MEKTTKKSLLVALACCFALCATLALAACGGGGDAAKDYVGTWTMEEMTVEGETMSGADLSALGMEVVLTLNQDGTASMDMLGEATTGTWKATNANDFSITLDEMGTQSGKLEGGKLVLADGEDIMTFAKK